MQYINIIGIVMNFQKNSSIDFLVSNLKLVYK